MTKLNVIIHFPYKYKNEFALYLLNNFDVIDKFNERLNNDALSKINDLKPNELYNIIENLNKTAFFKFIDYVNSWENMIVTNEQYALATVKDIFKDDIIINNINYNGKFFEFELDNDINIDDCKYDFTLCMDVFNQIFKDYFDNFKDNIKYTLFDKEYKIPIRIDYFYIYDLLEYLDIGICVD